MRIKTNNAEGWNARYVRVSEATVKEAVTDLITDVIHDEVRKQLAGRPMIIRKYRPHIGRTQKGRCRCQP